MDIYGYGHYTADTCRTCYLIMYGHHPSSYVSKYHPAHFKTTARDFMPIRKHDYTDIARCDFCERDDVEVIVIEGIPKEVPQ